MLRLLMWTGVFVGTPSAVTMASTMNVSMVDDFVVIFVVSAAALLIAILPRLSGRAEA
jgi:hypothetical protein